MDSELPLDDKTLRFIEQRIAAMKSIESELSGALALLIELNGLTGGWRLDLPNRRLVRQAEAPAEAQLMKAAA